MKRILQLRLQKADRFPVEEFMSTGFTHHCQIIASVKDRDERLYFIRRAATEHYRVGADCGMVRMAANRQGLVSLAGVLMALAGEGQGSHVHLDEHNSLEEGSCELVIERA